WGPAIELRNAPQPSKWLLPAEWSAELGLPEQATYAAGAEIFLRALAGEASVASPHDFPRKSEIRDSTGRELHPQPSDDGAFPPGCVSRLLAGFRLQRRRGKQRTCLEEFSHLLSRQRPGEQKALHLVAEVVAQECLLLHGLDAFGDDGHSERLAHADDRLRNG